MGNSSRAATGRGLTTTGQRVVARTASPRVQAVPFKPRVKTYRPSRPGERERALRHIASSAHGRRSNNPKIIQLLAKIRDAVQQLRSARNRRSGS